ncbi:Choline transport system permease protein OpuBB [Leucobacter aridicollis]|uniref:Osmoprotectant transport system permease protein n=1 Tax=Leucobacter aridicollis TaxID=283878 RepID=A0A852RNP6_9MICO|nr:ABC transporter permease [Leucobacter aridicollis]MBL3680751.1 ABC transporter permease [Leucobacter aridicollis]MCS3429066.1 osmoprotectant transport system permease protein [Leucobacter aridicollis]NYD28262.1 osmoprotectant transport system permease protein [Leucobacter aridicollis]
MSFLEFLIKRADDMLEMGIGHAAVVGISVLLATVLGVALGVLTHRNERARDFTLAVSGAMLTIPSFALFILLLGPLGLGAKPVIVALTMYGLMPIIRNTVAGLNGVDPAVTESARGMGLTRMQRLLRVELPLAWPVIITGVRVTTLSLLGIAAIGSIVNGPGFGNFIFTGLARVGTPVAINFVLAGALGVVILAILSDVLFHIVRRLTTSKGIR